MTMIDLNFKTYADLAKDIKSAIAKIPRDIDIIVGVPRSGMIPAYMIGSYLNLPVSTLDEYLNDVTPSSGARPLKLQNSNLKKVLIVDDCVGTGDALRKVKEKLLKKAKNVEYIFFAAYVTDTSGNLVDMYASVCNKPRLFQWNYLNHEILLQACVDIDGVLCVDPTAEQNDDGEKYIHFVLNAAPLFIPNFKIRALVSSRLEKYRKQTEDWLHKNNVQYDELYMLDLPSGEERLRLGCHAVFKAGVYSKLKDCILFVESNRNQAKEIAIITNKPVISLETDELFPETTTVS